jgi:hypothetical protein
VVVQTGALSGGTAAHIAFIVLMSQGQAQSAWHRTPGFAARHFLIKNKSFGFWIHNWIYTVKGNTTIVYIDAKRKRKTKLQSSSLPKSNLHPLTKPRKAFSPGKSKTKQEASQPTPPRRFTTSEDVVVADPDTSTGINFCLKPRPMPARRRRAR